ncbi:YbaB/EbfC family nucleoid-associated protein [Caulobacter sp. S45]|uniref:YbaB/EbfC family nucleoid-associated protein n=1 Tax=Caulobacter sp. S45 TaxID=1641861 RepID=UPI00131C82D3|nr:YbaB/EbfC family nucleoid-associated protein [Caulobacter sp. S45]
MKDFGAMMKQAQGLQQKIQDAQARLAETSVEGQAGGGLVKLTLQGSGELKSVVIDPSLMGPDEGEVLSDLMVAAHADAKKKLDAEQERLMHDAMGPLAGMGGGGMPGFPGMKF